jgi:hypothetical protein
MQQLALANGNGITAASVSQLTGQSDAVLGCGSSGFSLATSPSSATVSSGSTASYALAITPTGGCGGNGNAAGTVSGAYTIMVQASSGSTVQNAKLTLVVK